MSTTPPITNCGVKLSYFTHFIEAFGGRETFQGLTTTDVCEKFVKPATANEQSSWIEHLQGENSPAVGVASAFISHAWHYHFVDGVDAMIDHFAGEEDPVIWFDLFCNNQHKAVDLPFEWWCNTFKSAIASLNRTVVILSPWNNPHPLTRAWCLWEIYCTIDTNSRFEIAMTRSETQKFITDLVDQGHEVINTMLATVKSERSECWKPEDQQRIHDTIRRTVGFAVVDGKVFEKFREWFITKIQSSIATTRGLMDDILGFPLSSLQLRQRLGALYFEQGEYEKSVVQNLEILNLMKEVYAEDDDPMGFMISIKKNLARTYECQGKYDEAVDVFQQILRSYQKKHGNMHQNTLLALLDLERAKSQQQKKTDLKRVVVPGRDDTIIDVNQKKDEANTEIGKDTKIDLSSLLSTEADEKEVVTLESLDTKHVFAQHLQRQKQYQLAEIFYRECYEKGLLHFGADHPAVLTYQHNLGELYNSISEYAKGEEMLGDCSERLKKVLGPEHPNTLVAVKNYVVSLKQQKKFKEAEKALLESLDDCKAAYGIESDKTLQIMAALGSFYFQIEKHQDALPYLETVAMTSVQVFGPLDNRTMTALWNYSSCKSYLNKDDKKEVTKGNGSVESSPTVVAPISGWLFKRSRWLKSWRLRHFTIDDHKIVIAKDQSSKAHLTIPLTQSTSTKIVTFPKGAQFYFDLTSSDAKEVYVFASTSEQERKKWMDAINKHKR